MGVLERLSCAKLAGAGLLLGATFGFLIYDSIFLSESEKNGHVKAAFRTRGIGATGYGATIAAIVLSALIVLLLLVSLVMELLELSGIIPKIIWIPSVVLFIGVLIAAAIAVDKSKYGYDGTEYIRLYEDLNAEDHDDVKDFIKKATGSGAQALQFQQLKSKDSKSLWKPWMTEGPRSKVFSLNKTVTAFSDDDIEDICRGYTTQGNGWPYFRYTHYVEGISKAQPLDEELDLYRWRMDFEEADLSGDFYQESYLPACYGGEFDGDPPDFDDPKFDPCSVKVKFEGCAPGWSAGLYASVLWCEPFKECKKDLKRYFHFYEDVLVAKLTEMPIGDDVYDVWTLGEGWNRYAEWRSYKKSQSAKDAAEYERKDSAVFHALNLTFLIVGVVGWLLLVVGIVVGFLGGGGAVGSS